MASGAKVDKVGGMDIVNNRESALIFSNVKFIARAVNLGICFVAAGATAWQVIRYFRSEILQEHVLQYATFPFAVVIGTIVVEVVLSGMDWNQGERRGFDVKEKDER